MAKDDRDFSEEQKKRFFKPISHHHKRRAWWHDYTSRCFYMVTMTKSCSTPNLSNLVGSLKEPGSPPETILTPTGLIIARALTLTHEKFPSFEIRKQVIMPDHIHLLVNITADDSPHLGKIIGWFAGECTRRLRAHMSTGSNLSFFEGGFHDWIVHKEGQVASFENYILDNPRRLMIKQARPDLFTANQIVAINGSHFSTKGNIFLLRHPLRAQVRFSRTLSPEQWEARCRCWDEIIQQGGVLISPFIHPNEKEFMTKAIEAGAGIIILVDNGFRERSAPYGKLFDLCAEGRALIIAPADYDPTKKVIQRAECLRLNSWARLFAEQDPECILR